MADADEATRRLLRKLAGSPATVRWDEHAGGNMLAWGLRREDVREAICDYLDRGKRVKVTSIRQHPKALVGQAAYEVKPEIGGRRFYVRMAIYSPVAAGESLLVISVHVD